jgi:hypothetical protein
MINTTAKRLLYVSTPILSFLGVAFVWFALLGFRESVYCRKGSWDFWSGVTETVIKQFPTPQAVSVPNYHFGCGDGPKRPDQAVSYRSRLSTAELLALAQRHITACGYTAETVTNASGMFYMLGSKTLYLSVTTADDGNTELHAEVTFYQ